MEAQGRFTLYALEDGEEHVGDVLVEYSAAGFNIEGKLRLGTRALYMDADDDQHPVIKIPYAGVLGLGRNAEAVIIECNKVTTMLRHGRIGPSEKLTIKDGTHNVKLAWEKPDRFLDKLTALLGAYTQKKPYKLPDPSFDYSRINAHTEPILLELPVSKLIPLRNIRAKMVLTHKALYLQCYESLSGQPLQKTPLENVFQCARRKRFYKDVAIELLCDGGVHMLVFETEAACSQFWNIITTKTNVPILKTKTIENMTRLWVNREMSTYDYLMNINWAAGRSLNDLSQYPVLPWVIADYTSSKLDLTDAKSYRDLSRPVGALNPTRLESFLIRKRESGEPYHYGTHYSTPSYVMYYLLREHPEWMLLMHNGKYDKGARLFHSLPQSWENVNQLPNDVKEVIPQFYNAGGAFLTSTGLNLGWITKDPPVRVPDNVALPPWAISPRDFVEKNRAALESEHVSQHVHKWIDLMFGCNSRGAAAEAHHNLFHPMTYETFLLDETVDVENEAVQVQLREFGQCPVQVFTAPHPPRKSAKDAEGRVITRLDYFDPAHVELSPQLMPAQQVATTGMRNSASSTAFGSTSDFLRENSAPSFNGKTSFVENTSILQSSPLQPLKFTAAYDVKCMRQNARGVSAAAVEAPNDWLLRDMELAHASASGVANSGVPDFTKDKVDLVFVNGENGQLPIVDATHGTHLRTLQLGADPLLSVAIAPTQPAMLFAGSADGHVYCYSMRHGRLEDRVEAHVDEGVRALELSPAADRLVSGGGGGLKIWSVSTEGVDPVVEGWGAGGEEAVSATTIGGVSWAGGGAWLVYTSDKGVAVCDPRQANGGEVLRLDVGDAYKCAFIDDSPTVACVAASGLYALDLRAGSPLWCNTRDEYLSDSLAVTSASIWAGSSHMMMGYDPANGVAVTTHIPTRTPVQALTTLVSDDAQLALLTHDNKHSYMQLLAKPAI